MGQCQRRDEGEDLIHEVFQFGIGDVREPLFQDVSERQPGDHALYSTSGGGLQPFTATAATGRVLLVPTAEEHRHAVAALTPAVHGVKSRDSLGFPVSGMLLHDPRLDFAPGDAHLFRRMEQVSIDRGDGYVEGASDGFGVPARHPQPQGFPLPAREIDLISQGVPELLQVLQALCSNVA